MTAEGRAVVAPGVAHPGAGHGGPGSCTPRTKFLHVLSAGREPLANWVHVLYESLALAKHLKRSLVEPCVAGGYIVPCHPGGRVVLVPEGQADAHPGYPSLAQDDPLAVPAFTDSCRMGGGSGAAVSESFLSGAASGKLPVLGKKGAAAGAGKGAAGVKPGGTSKLVDDTSQAVGVLLARQREAEAAALAASEAIAAGVGKGGAGDAEEEKDEGPVAAPRSTLIDSDSAGGSGGGGANDEENDLLEAFGSRPPPARFTYTAGSLSARLGRSYSLSLYIDMSKLRASTDVPIVRFDEWARCELGVSRSGKHVSSAPPKGQQQAAGQASEPPTWEAAVEAAATGLALSSAYNTLEEVVVAPRGYCVTRKAGPGQEKEPACRSGGVGRYRFSQVWAPSEVGYRIRRGYESDAHMRRFFRDVLEDDRRRSVFLFDVHPGFWMSYPHAPFTRHTPPPWNPLHGIAVKAWLRRKTAPVGGLGSAAAAAAGGAATAAAAGGAESLTAATPRSVAPAPAPWPRYIAFHWRADAVREARMLACARSLGHRAKLLVKEWRKAQAQGGAKLVRLGAGPALAARRLADAATGAAAEGAPPPSPTPVPLAAVLLSDVPSMHNPCPHWATSAVGFGGAEADRAPPLHSLKRLALEVLAGGGSVPSPQPLPVPRAPAGNGSSTEDEDGADARSSRPVGRLLLQTSGGASGSGGHGSAAPHFKLPRYDSDHPGIDAGVLAIREWILATKAAAYVTCHSGMQAVGGKEGGDGGGVGGNGGGQAASSDISEETCSSVCGTPPAGSARAVEAMRYISRILSARASTGRASGSFARWLGTAPAQILALAAANSNAAASGSDKGSSTGEV